MLQGEWEQSALPRDIRRLAECVRKVLGIIDSGSDADRVDILKNLLQDGKARNADEHSIDWSPYRSVLNYAAHDYPAKFKKIVKSERTRTRILVYPEVLVLLGVTKDESACPVAANN